MLHLRIREAREAAGLSQKELAEKMGVKPATLNGYEKGNHDPKSDGLSAIADICDVTVDFLLGRDDVLKRAEQLDEREEWLLDTFRQFNEEGKERLLETVDDMAQSRKYKKYNKVELGFKEV